MNSGAGWASAVLAGVTAVAVISFGVWVHCGVALVAVEASRGALVGRDGRRDPQWTGSGLGHAPSDHEKPAAVLAQVLAGHRGQQLSGLAERAAQLAALDRGEHRGGVRAETVHQLLSGPGIVPVAVRLGARGVVTAQRRCSASEFDAEMVLRNEPTLAGSWGDLRGVAK